MRLIDDWRAAHKLLSVKLAGLWALFVVYAMAQPQPFIDAWIAFQAWLRANVPAPLHPLIAVLTGFVAFAVPYLARTVAQASPPCPPAAPAIDTPSDPIKPGSDGSDGA